MAVLLYSGLFLHAAAAATGLALSWQASPSSPNIDGYRVYYGTSSGNYSQHADFLGTGTSVTVVAPPTGSTYYYTVVAYKGSLESSDSNEVMRSTPAASPTPTPTPTPVASPTPTVSPTPFVAPGQLRHGNKRKIKAERIRTIKAAEDQPSPSLTTLMPMREQ